jgi:hypothetical protein
VYRCSKKLCFNFYGNRSIFGVCRAISVIAVEVNPLLRNTVLSSAPLNDPGNVVDDNVRRPTVIQRGYRDDHLKGGGKADGRKEYNL